MMPSTALVMKLPYARNCAGVPAGRERPRLSDRLVLSCGPAPHSDGRRRSGVETSR